MQHSALYPKCDMNGHLARHLSMQIRRCWLLPFCFMLRLSALLGASSWHRVLLMLLLRFRLCCYYGLKHRLMSGWAVMLCCMYTATHALECMYAGCNTCACLP